MSAQDFATTLVASLDDRLLRAFADRLRPYLAADSDDCLLLTAAQAADRLRLHPKTVVRMAREGRLPAVKVGSSWRFFSDKLALVPTTRTAITGKPCSAVRRRPAEIEPASVRAIRGERECGERSGS